MTEEQKDKILNGYDPVHILYLARPGAYVIFRFAVDNSYRVFLGNDMYRMTDRVGPDFASVPEALVWAECADLALFERKDSLTRQMDGSLLIPFSADNAKSILRPAKGPGVS